MKQSKEFLFVNGLHAKLKDCFNVLLLVFYLFCFFFLVSFHDAIKCFDQLLQENSQNVLFSLIVENCNSFKCILHVDNNAHSNIQFLGKVYLRCNRNPAVWQILIRFHYFLSFCHLSQPIFHIFSLFFALFLSINFLLSKCSTYGYSETIPTTLLSKCI